MGNTPNIRFKGYTDDWEQRKLGAVVEDYVEKTTVEDQYPVLTSSQQKGIVLQDDYFSGDRVSQNGNVGYFIIPRGYFAFRSRSDNDVFVFNRNDVADMGIISYFYPVFKPKGVDSDFLLRRLNYGLEDQIKINSEGTGQHVLSLKKFKNMVGLFPSYEEQKKVGSYFSKIDNLISRHQQEYDNMAALKKYMLQKMFPANGEKVPEIRFEGFTDLWEQRKLDDWGTFYYGRSCPKWSVTEDATIPCIRYGELYTKFGAKIDKVYSYTNMPPDNLRFSKGTEVLIPRVGEDPMDYNHCTWLSMPNVAIGEMISVFNTDNNPLFTATMFNATLRNEFAMRGEGGSVTNLYFEKLKNIEVSFPSKDEQVKIATYFENLDHIITLHQRKRDELLELKKYMLQNMFPKKEG